MIYRRPGSKRSVEVTAMRLQILKEEPGRKYSKGRTREEEKGTTSEV